MPRGDDASDGRVTRSSALARRPTAVGEKDSGLSGERTDPLPEQAGWSKAGSPADDGLACGRGGAGQTPAPTLGEHASWALEDWVWSPASLVRCDGALGSPG